MTEEEFMTERVDRQIAWYDGKSKSHKRWYNVLRVAEIFLAAAIPLLVGCVVSDYPFAQIVVGILGVLVAVIAGVLGLFNFQENWIEYRTTCESLRHEKYLFLTRTEPYRQEDPFSLFVSRIESLISAENSKWSQLIRSAKKEQKNG